MLYQLYPFTRAGLTHQLSLQSVCDSKAAARRASIDRALAATQGAPTRQKGAGAKCLNQDGIAVELVIVQSYLSQFSFEFPVTSVGALGHF